MNAIPDFLLPLQGVPMLSPREAYIVLGKLEGRTHVDMARRLGCSGARVGQLHAKAMRKLRWYARPIEALS
jgi:DNA-binding CsgD family transcriptional regulator